MQRVVTPVVGILVRHCTHGCLLFLGGRAGILGDRRRLLVGALLGDRRDIEGGQQVHRVHAGAGQLVQVTHTVGLELSERHVGAAHVLGHRGVGSGEVTHVQLVDRALRIVLNDRRLRICPHGGHGRRVIHVDRDRAGRVDGQAHRVGISDEVLLHLARFGHVDAHLPQVLGALVDLAGSIVHAPTPIVATHRFGAQAIAWDISVGTARRRGVPRHQRDALRRRSPQGERRVARLVPIHAVRGLGGLLRVQGVEHGSDLHASEGVDTLPRLLGDRDLTGEGLACHGLVDGGLQRDVAVEIGMRRRHLSGQIASHTQGGRRGPSDRAVRQTCAALGGGHQLVGQSRGAVQHLRARDALGEQGGRPREGIRAHPVRTLLAVACDRGVSAGDSNLVRRGIVGEGHELVRFRCKLIVGAADGAVLPVILVVGSADGNLELVVALRQRRGGVRVRAVTYRLQQRRQALSLPVFRTAERLLEGTGQRHRLIGRRVPHAMRRPVVIEGHRRRFIERIGDVRAPRGSTGTEGRIPGAALGDLVLVVASRQRERCTVDTRGIARERRLGAVRRPVGVASHRLIVAAGDCHQHIRARLRTSRFGSSSRTFLV